MNINGKKIGIWGFGIVGKAFARWCVQQQDCSITVLDNRVLTDDEQVWLAQHKGRAIIKKDSAAIHQFFRSNDFIFPSPGVVIDIGEYYQTHSSQIIPELDLFYSLWHKPIIAITGSVGKTTVTSLLSQLITSYATVGVTGGNIGTPSIDLLEQQDSAAHALLEVSDVQLKFCKTFAPSLAVWTNFFPNHLDWHGSEDAYFLAKCQLLAHQPVDARALVPLALYDRIHTVCNPASHIHTFSVDRPAIFPDNIHYFIENRHIKKYENDTVKNLISCNELPPITFVQNWLIITATLDLLGYSLNDLPKQCASLILPAHRLEIIATHAGVTFCNDSKSTAPPAALAAVEQYNEKPIHLFIGGLSKGIDREPLIAQLKNKVHFIYCFGAEAKKLNALCKKHNIASYAFSDLNTAFAACTHRTKPGDLVLFSPAGSSFDLFKNFNDRGLYFKKLVHALFT